MLMSSVFINNDNDDNEIICIFYFSDKPPNKDEDRYKEKLQFCNAILTMITRPGKKKRNCLRFMKITLKNTGSF